MKDNFDYKEDLKNRLQELKQIDGFPIGRAAHKYIGQFKKNNLLKHEYNQYTKIKM